MVFGDENKIDFSLHLLVNNVMTLTNMLHILTINNVIFDYSTLFYCK